MSVDTTAVRPADSAALRAWLIVLTFTTGLVDAVSVLGLGRVFTANMTGNVVFLGFALAGIPGFSALRSLVSLSAFLAGALGGGCLATRLEGSPARWLLTVSLIESGIFGLAALASGPYEHERLTPVVALYSLIALTAAAMGLRNATVRRLNVPDLTTTVVTLTLTGLAADSSAAGGTNPRWARRLASVAAMLGGAAVGALLVVRRGLVAPLVLTVAITLLSVIVYARCLASRDPEKGD
jgi:uncharacterized membrane protein YoaK (UPF0700 family)